MTAATRSRLFHFVLISAAAAMVAAAPASAKNDGEHGKGHKEKHEHKKQGKGHGKHKDKHDDHGRDHGGDRVLVHIGEPDVIVIREKLHPYYVKHCPPGLAKKHNGCLPPGQAKKYRVGHPLPAGVVVWDVPQDVVVLLPAAPVGARYVWVDRDVLLISEATKKVLDAAVILSAL